MRKIKLSYLITIISLTVIFSGCSPSEKKDLNDLPPIIVPPPELDS